MGLGRKTKDAEQNYAKLQLKKQNTSALELNMDDDDTVTCGSPTTKRRQIPMDEVSSKCSKKRQLPDGDAMVKKSDGPRACCQCSACIDRGVHVEDKFSIVQVKGDGNCLSLILLHS